MADTPYTKPIWMSEGDEKRARVQDMFGRLASRYDLLNSLMCFRLHYRWRALAVEKLHLGQGDTVLDLCCGTGAFARPLRNKIGLSGAILGLDFCLPMLKIATQNHPEDVKFALGDALALPVGKDSVDGVTVGWGIRNVIDVDAAHREIFRVLKPTKRYVSVDMAQPANPVVNAISGKLFSVLVPALAALFGNGEAYTYLPKSTEKFKSRTALADSMKNAGFIDVHWQDLMFGNICIHWGLKVDRPEMTGGVR